jgi:probable phosphoglycerate mutase
MMPRGEIEATALKRRLGNLEFAHVLTSPRQRPRRTCELVGLEGAAEVRSDLAEWDYGDYEDRRSADIHQERPGWDVFRDGCPGGESPAQVSDRADRLIEHFRSLDGTVALFSHGQFGSGLGARWIGLPVIEAQHLLLNTASLSVLEDHPHHPERPVIASWNTTDEETAGRPGTTDVRDGAEIQRRAVARWENEGGESPTLRRIHHDSYSSSSRLAGSGASALSSVAMTRRITASSSEAAQGFRMNGTSGRDKAPTEFERIRSMSSAVLVLHNEDHPPRIPPRASEPSPA